MITFIESAMQEQEYREMINDSSSSDRVSIEYPFESSIVLNSDNPQRTIFSFIPVLDGSLDITVTSNDSSIGYGYATWDVVNNNGISVAAVTSGYYSAITISTQPLMKLTEYKIIARLDDTSRKVTVDKLTLRVSIRPKYNKYFITKVGE